MKITPMQAEILRYLSEKRGRAADIAKALEFNVRSTWQALQQLVARDLVSKDEFDIYSITDEGKKALEDALSQTSMRVKILLMHLQRLSNKATDEEEKELLKILEKLRRHE